MEDSTKPIKNAYVVAIRRLHLHGKGGTLPAHNCLAAFTAMCTYGAQSACYEAPKSLPSHGGLSYNIGTRNPWSTSVHTVSLIDSTDYCIYQLWINDLHIRAGVMSVVNFRVMTNKIAMLKKSECISEAQACLTRCIC